MRSDLDTNDASLIGLRPSRYHTWATILVAGSAFSGFLLVLPYANTPLVQLNAFFPSLDAIVFITDAITAVLLFAQYAISRTRFLAMLASGYLFTAFVMVPHALTFSGAFSPNGLLGANIQTGSWLFIFWHLGFAFGLLAYALFREDKQPTPLTKTPAWIVITFITFGLIVVVVGLTWLATTGAALLPPIVLDASHISSVVRYPISFTIAVSGVAIFVLFLRRERSELDQWLMVVAFVSIGELILSGLVATVRFSLGFYAARGFSLVTSSIVLIVLLVETTRLYARLMRTNAQLRREQNSKLINMDVMAASIAHEVRQPLTAITSFGETAITLLKKNRPDIDEVALTVRDMLEASQRADQIFKNIRTLFGRAEPERARLDLNGIALETLAALKLDLARHAIKTELELAPTLPAILGSKSQMQEVILNLITNAIEAMTAAEHRRNLTIATTPHQDGGVVLEIKDTGHGFINQSLASIFDPFITTKTHGMGLGLALCRLIIQGHGGTITASHSSPSGAVFRIVLPAAS